MKQATVMLSARTTSQIAELAKLWGEPKERHNTPVITRCVELVWLSKFGEDELKKLKDLDQEQSEQ
jgi:hypothetical protein